MMHKIEQFRTLARIYANGHRRYVVQFTQYNREGAYWEDISDEFETAEQAKDYMNSRIVI